MSDKSTLFGDKVLEMVRKVLELVTKVLDLMIRHKLPVLFICATLGCGLQTTLVCLVGTGKRNLSFFAAEATKRLLL